MPIDLLDHGYVNFIEHWGSDERIIESARMSTNKGFLGWEPKVTYVCDKCGDKRADTSSGPVCFNNPCNGKALRRVEVSGDEKLLRYLWEHKHMTPFEMAGMTVEVQAPIFVFREWHRHRTQSYNEMSGRYTELPDLVYIPSIERLKASKQSKANKQSSESGFSDQDAVELKEYIEWSSGCSREEYSYLLNKGVSREIARIVLPVNQYSRMRASANLRNWLAFLTLRQDQAAQWEIRQYADAVATFIEEKFPRTYALFKG